MLWIQGQKCVCVWLCVCVCEWLMLLRACVCVCIHTHTYSVWTPPLHVCAWHLNERTQGSDILIPEQTPSHVSLISPPQGFMGDQCAAEDYIREIKRVHICTLPTDMVTPRTRHHWVKPIDHLHSSQPLPSALSLFSPAAHHQVW